MAVDYKSVEFGLHENLVQLHSALSLLEFDQEFLDSLTDTMNLIKTKQYNVAVMGEFKRGKSSLINALLGSGILPADATPTTATVNRITYGSEPKTVITYKDGETEEIQIDKLTEYVTKLTQDGESRAARVKEAVVYFPTVICQNNVDIIDTPGLNDEARMTKITIDMIKHVDAIIVPIHARSPFSISEKQFVCQLIESDAVGNLIFVVTFMDQMDPDDYVYEQFMDFIKNRIQTEVMAELDKRGSSEDVISKAHRMFDNIKIHGISARQALEFYKTNNRKLWVESRFEAFQEYLRHAVTSQQMENAVRKTKERIQYIVSQFNSQNNKRLDIFNAELHNINDTEEIVIKDFCTKSKRGFDMDFGRIDGKLNEIINSLNTEKEYIVRQFVKRLSLVKADTNDEILNALTQAQAGVSGEMTHRIDGVTKEIMRIFESILTQFSGLYKDKLKKSLDFLGVSADFDALTTGMSEVIRASLLTLDFKWSHSPIPETQDLTNCNPIETVKKAADISVTGCITMMENAVSTIRKEWFSLLSKYINALRGTCEDALARKRETHDVHYKAYISNYSVQYDRAKSIQQILI